MAKRPPTFSIFFIKSIEIEQNFYFICISPPYDNTKKKIKGLNVRWHVFSFADFYNSKIERKKKTEKGKKPFLLHYCLH